MRQVLFTIQQREGKQTVVRKSEMLGSFQQSGSLMRDYLENYREPDVPRDEQTYELGIKFVER